RKKIQKVLSPSISIETDQSIPFPYFPIPDHKKDHKLLHLGNPSFIIPKFQNIPTLSIGRPLLVNPLGPRLIGATKSSLLGLLPKLVCRSTSGLPCADEVPRRLAGVVALMEREWE